MRTEIESNPSQKVKSTASRLDRIQQRLATELAKPAPILPGSILQRHVRCGNRGCRCHADPPQLHGPYWQWTRKEHGKTITRLLTPAQARRYQPWLTRARRIHELLRELETLHVTTLEDQPGPNQPQRRPANTGKPKQDKATKPTK